MKTKFIHELEDSGNYPEKSSDSLQTTISSDSRITSSSSTLSPKKSCRRSIQKRVITVPINDGDGARLKGEMGTPPSDSWSWRKYGQKPIKGSPFPRGYYRCSSSKGCPARKQVEKSREDPNMLVVAYYCDHNHACPPPRKNNHQNRLLCNLYEHEKDDEEQEEEDFQKLSKNHVSESKQYNIDSKFSNNTGIELSEHKVIGDKNGVRANDYESWLCDYDDATYSTLLEVPFFTFEEKVTTYGDHMSMVYTMRHEEDEAIFADLGELPECSTVFNRRTMEMEDERRQQSFTPCYGTT